jgi:tetratricopeptide (TPR) repeat protein
MITGKKRSYHLGVLAAVVMLFMGSMPGKAVEQVGVQYTQKEISSFKAARKHHVRGEQYYADAKYKKAEKSFLKCIKLFPRYSSADYFLANISYDTGDLMKALARIENAEKNFKVMNTLLVETEKKYREDLRLEAANIRKDLRNERYDASGSQRADMRKRLTSISKRLRRRIDSGRHLLPEYHYVHGNIHFKMKQFKKAYEQYLRTIGIKKDHAKAYNNLISLLFMVRKYQDAAAFIKQAEANNVQVNPKLKGAVLKALGN